MAYIRVKKINKYLYAYLVENVSTTSGPRQKVKQYLGRVYELEKSKEIESSNNGKNKQEILLNLVIPELKVRGFRNKKDKYTNKNLIFDVKYFTLKKKTKSKTEKDAIIKLNDGYLCSFTLNRILSFEKSKEVKKDAQVLAKYFLESGLQINQERFVSFYQLI
jgi:hypothetical protein